jgi:ferritin
MLVSRKMAAAINKQIGNEFGASLQYVSIGAHFGNESLPELSKFFHAQANEERDHALKFVNYLVDAGSEVAVPAVPAPRAGFKSAEEAVKLSLEWELTVTKQISGLVDLARAEKDHTTETFLQWFVTEQLEEVSTMDALLRMVRRAGEQGLLFVEEYLARRGGPQPEGGSGAGSE